MELDEAVQIVEAIVSEIEVEIRDGARADIAGQMKVIREAWDLIKDKLSQVR